MAIHDAARPFVRAAEIAACLEAVGAPGIDGAVLGVPLADTLKRVGDGGAVVETVPRRDLWRAQTPQVFHFAKLLAAHRAAASLGEAEATALTDDAAVAERAGLKVVMVAGSEDNRKITTADDLHSAAMETRTAFGFDVHGFAAGSAVMLGGSPSAHSQALAGHSDADVVLHALTDALLGTIGAGDIGKHFPPSDPQWRGASSDRFLRHAVELVTARGGRIVHLDVTIVCEAPKVGSASHGDDPQHRGHRRHRRGSGEREGDDDRGAWLHLAAAEGIAAKRSRLSNSRGTRGTHVRS